MPIDYSKYPKNWKTEIRPRILKRAGHKCEWCGLKNYSIGLRDRFGVWHDEDDIHGMNSDHGFYLFGGYGAWIKVIRIVLTVAHIRDPDPMNCADDNLAALCQRCHLNHDRPHHLKKARKTRKNRDKKSGQLDMFEE